MMGANDYYAVKAEPLPERLARGWHCLGPVSQFDDGKPHAVEAFNTELVIFKTEGGELAALNNFCPHMGAALSEGRVRGDSVACPFHDWRWGPDGRCTAIPYARRIPSRARTRAWQLSTVNDVLYVWYDPEGNDPDFMLSPIADFGDYSPWSYSQHRLATNTRELVDNLVDVAHFFYVHGLGVGKAASFFGNHFEGHTAWQFIEGGENNTDGIDRLAFGVPVELVHGRRTETCYVGPSYLKSRLIYWVEDRPLEAYIILGQQPIDKGNFILHMLITARNDPALSPDENARRAALVCDSLRTSTLQDVHIWETKTRIDNPLLCDGDGPIYQLRRWYEQFFVDRANIKPEMTAPFKHVTDTSYSYEAWLRQGEENRAELAAADA